MILLLEYYLDTQIYLLGQKYINNLLKRQQQLLPLEYLLTSVFFCFFFNFANLGLDFWEFTGTIS